MTHLVTSVIHATGRGRPLPRCGRRPTPRPPPRPERNAAAVSAAAQPPLTALPRSAGTLRAMTERAPRQPRPNRRYRRLVPTAVAVAALAAAGTSVGAPAAHAARRAAPAAPPRAHVHPPRTPAALVPRGAGTTGPATPGVGGS